MSRSFPWSSWRSYTGSACWTGRRFKVARCGGIEPARRQVEYLFDNDLMFLGSGLTDPDVSLAASLHLFAAFGLKYPAALNGPQFLSGSILKSPLERSGDRMQPPAGAGLGIEVDEAALYNPFTPGAATGT